MIRWIVRVSMAIASLLVLARAAAAYEPPAPQPAPQAAYAPGYGPDAGYVAVGEYGADGYAYGQASAARTSPVNPSAPPGQGGYGAGPRPCCESGGYQPPPPQAYYPPAPGPCCQSGGYPVPPPQQASCCEPGHWPPPIYHQPSGSPSCGGCGGYQPPVGHADCGACGGYGPPSLCAAPGDPRYPPPCQPLPVGYGEVHLNDSFFWGAGGVGPEVVYSGGGGGYAYAGAGASSSSWAAASASARVSIGGGGGHRPPPHRPPPPHGCGCH